MPVRRHIGRLVLAVALIAFVGGAAGSIWTLRTAERLPSSVQENVLWGTTQAQFELYRTLQEFNTLALESGGALADIAPWRMRRGIGSTSYGAASVCSVKARSARS